MVALASSLACLRSKPFTVTLPEVGFNKAQIILKVVVLPAPLGPNKPKISPLCTLKLD